MSQDEAVERPAEAIEQSAQATFVPPSVNAAAIAQGISYTYHSAIPAALADGAQTPCVLGVDEAGRGPVLGPMVYGVFYLPLTQHTSLLADTHHFDDSKVLTPQVRSDLMRRLCTPASDLHQACGWATRSLSARDISAGMLQPAAGANLNRQAMDATIALIQEVLDKGINVREIYIDTIGAPHVYQAKLERIFPAVKITVAKKADSLYPCVSAASVCAKVSRDAALEVAYGAYAKQFLEANGVPAVGWGSGYPSDARTVAWLKANMDPLFGWDDECRFSWGTAKDVLDGKGVKVTWPEPADGETARVTTYFSANADEEYKAYDELAGWYGKPATGLC